ncbi:molybdopterin cofactor-binding domain-containing protein [Chryseolinea sp. T2]|uniref:xanthine dehydrogenase family protein molybdopterin-binding subunit n=1 Tax=Chryseolinea sp. T2 TaxID=3129255 RepID=UPI003076A8DF
MTSRRDFIKQSIAVGTSLALGFSRSSYALVKGADLIKAELTPFIIIDNNGLITLINRNPDMGQGSTQAIPTLIAEELEVDLDQVQIINSNGDERYGLQVSGGSGSVVRAWLPMRKAGAAAREMLVQAAAQTWKTSISQCKAERGRIINTATNEALTYGQLISAATKLDVPQDPILKSPAEFRLIGKATRRPEIADRVNGKAIYGIDVNVEGMVYACILHSPGLHNKIKSLDESDARKVTGVLDVIKCERPMPHRSSEAIAIIATNYWSALQGRKQLKVEWESSASDTNSRDYVDRMNAAARTSGALFSETGSFDATYAASDRKLESIYESNFLVHSSMEPENAVAHVKDDGSAEVWVPYQSPDWAKRDVANFLQLPPDKVIVNIRLMGGSFGRKSYADFLLEACMLSRHIHKPVKLIWSREDDISQGPFRPAMLSQMQGIIENSRIVGLHHHAIGETFDGQIHKTLKAGTPDPVLCGEISFENSKYQLAYTKISHTRVTTDIPIIWWRSVWGANFAWSQECFIDEHAHQMNIDPLQARLDMLQDERYRKVLSTLATKSNYYQKTPMGEARGIAMWKCFGSISAACVTVKRVNQGVKVMRVVSVLDCGIFVNADMVKAQIEGSAVMGLSSATLENITFTNGECDQTNLHQYSLLRFRDTPEIETHIIADLETPGGVGEPSLPPIAPALGNAIFNLTGKRIRKLPINLKAL